MFGSRHLAQLQSKHCWFPFEILTKPVRTSVPLAQGSTVQECLKEDPSLWKAYQCYVTTFPGNRLFSSSKQLMRLMLRGLLKTTALGGSRHKAQQLPMAGNAASRLESNASTTHQGTVWHSISAQESLCGSSEKCCPR